MANIIAGGAGKWQKHIEAINQLAMVDVILAHSPSMVGKVVQHSFFGYRNLPNKASLWGGVLLKNENAMVYHPCTHYTDDLVYPAFLGQTNLHVAGSIPNGMPIPLYIRTLFP